MRFHIIALVASFSAGLLLMMLQVPPRRVVIKFPTPETSGDHLYTATNGQCYRISADERDCDAVKGVRSQPVGDEYDLDASP